MNILEKYAFSGSLSCLLRSIAIAACCRSHTYRIRRRGNRVRGPVVLSSRRPERTNPLNTLPEVLEQSYLTEWFLVYDVRRYYREECAWEDNGIGIVVFLLVDRYSSHDMQTTCWSLIRVSWSLVPRTASQNWFRPNSYLGEIQTKTMWLRSEPAPRQKWVRSVAFP